MQIRKAKASEFDDIWQLVKASIAYLQEQTIDQWGDFYPTADIIQQDIEEAQLFVALDKDAIIGIIVLNDFQDPQYDEVWWNYPESNPMVVHRLVIDPKCQGKGFGYKLMEFAEKYAVEHDFTSIRLDAYKLNKASVKLYENMNYVHVGEVYFEHRSENFYLFEKLLVLNGGPLYSQLGMPFSALPLDDFPTVTDFSVHAELTEEFGHRLSFRSVQFGEIATFPWWKWAERDLKKMDHKHYPIGQIDDPFDELEANWQIYIFQHGEFVYILQGDHPMCQVFPIWFRVDAVEYETAWIKTIAEFN